MAPDDCVQDFSRKSVHKFMGNPHPMIPSPVPKSPPMPRVQDSHLPLLSSYFLIHTPEFSGKSKLQ